MAKSQETFNKKEKEKKRHKKRLEKDQRKEERKANAGSKSFEDMLAYVDEFGQISSTPPDPAMRRNTVKIEDIEIGVRKREDVELPGVRTGTVTFFNKDKGYGFIKDITNQESIFVHINGLVDAIKENDKVTFETEMGMKGPNAISVKLVV